MLIQTPPAEVRLADIYDHFSDAQARAKSGEVGLLGILIKDAHLRAAAEAFLHTTEGVRLRSRVVVWFPAQGPLQKELIAADVGADSNEDLVWFDEKGQASKPILVTSEKNLLRALGGMVGGGFSDLRPTLSDLERKYPARQDLDRFLAFGDARRKDLGAGSQEPFRTWLVQLLNSGPHSDLGTWAAFRLLESNAVLQPGEPNPVPVVIQECRDAMSEKLGTNNHAFTPYLDIHYLFGWRALGPEKDIDPSAPYLATFRKQISRSPSAFSSDLYAFIARHLSREDRAWVLACWESASALETPEGSSVEEFPAYWLAADWLISQGAPKDWQSFMEAARSKAWVKPLAKLRSDVGGIAVYWNRDAGIHVTESDSPLYSDGFWKDPDAYLKPRGISQEAFQSEGVHYPELLSKPIFKPVYPSGGYVGMRMYRATVWIRCEVDEHGTVIRLNPLPGFGLHLFAPAVLPYLSKITYTPAAIGGRAVSCPFYWRYSFGIQNAYALP